MLTLLVAHVTHSWFSFNCMEGAIHISPHCGGGWLKTGGAVYSLAPPRRQPKTATAEMNEYW